MCFVKKYGGNQPISYNFSLMTKNRNTKNIRMSVGNSKRGRDDCCQKDPGDEMN